MYLTKITAEMIIDRFAQRLEKRVDDIDYLFDMTSGIEKWVQSEFALCFKGQLLPYIYNYKWDHIKTEGEKERISEILFEYNTGGEKAKRCDIAIIEEPFLYEYAWRNSGESGYDQEQSVADEQFNYFKECDDIEEVEKKWKSIDEKYHKELSEKYNGSRFHYIELKIINTSEKSCDLKKIFSDVKKFSDKDFVCKENKPASLIAVAVVRMYGGDGSDSSDIFEMIKEEIANCKDVPKDWKSLIYSIDKDGMYHLVSIYKEK